MYETGGPRGPGVVLLRRTLYFASCLIDFHCIVAQIFLDLNIPKPNAYAGGCNRPQYSGPPPRSKSSVLASSNDSKDPFSINSRLTVAQIDSA
jgi:hypothetical protein